MTKSAVIALGLAAFISTVAVTSACLDTSVGLYLYTGTTGKHKPCEVTTDSCPDFKACGFDLHARTVIIIHGWMGHYDGPCPKIIKDAYLDKDENVNVLVVNYGDCSADYTIAVKYSKLIGETVAKKVTFLAHNCGLNLKKLECVGHSLGAHVCGLCSAALPIKCYRITGLDTCSPDISGYPNDLKLDKSDCDYLQGIHTSSNFLAIKEPLGHCDHYPNGGSGQVGCIPPTLTEIVTGGCSHNKACDIFALSVLYPTMFPLQKQCDTHDQALANKCTKTPATIAYMGDPCYGIYGNYWVNSTDCYKKNNML